MIKTFSISDINKEIRLNFAKINSESDFNRVYFSDESKLCAEKSGKKVVWKKRDEPFTKNMIN
jgi:hypothetical protein